MYYMNEDEHDEYTIDKFKIRKGLLMKYVHIRMSHPHNSIHQGN